MPTLLAGTIRDPFIPVLSTLTTIPLPDGDGEMKRDPPLGMEHSLCRLILNFRTA